MIAFKMMFERLNKSEPDRSNNYIAVRISQGHKINLVEEKVDDDHHSEPSLV